MRHHLRTLPGVALLLLGVAFLARGAQDIDDIRPTKEPANAEEYFDAIQLEIAVGRPDLATKYLRGFAAKKFNDKELIKVADKEGMGPLLRWRKQPRWSADPKAEKQARQDVDDIIAATGEAYRKFLGDAGRIRELIGLLKASREENIYAVGQLRRSGAAVVPFLLEEMLRAREPADRLTIRQALAQMGPETIPPILAALDAPPGSVNVATLKLDLLDILDAKHSARFESVTPFLWYPSANKDESVEVKKKAVAMLSKYRGLHPSRLPDAKVALTAEAEKYFQGKMKFDNPAAVEVWRWEGNNVVRGWPSQPTLTKTQAEEHYGLFFARQALALDPTYRPAQRTAMAVAITKAVERGGIDKPLAASAPTVNELLSKADAELVIELLERGLKEKRTALVLTTVRALGDRAEVRAKKPTGREEAPLVRALTYPDPRVQFAAAEAVIRLPGTIEPRVATRVVDILKRALSPAAAYIPGNKILVALGSEEWRTRVRQVVSDAGFVPVNASDTRSAMRHLRSSAEFEAILLDSTLPGSGLAINLAQFKQDVDIAHVPVIVAAVPETRASVEALDRYKKLRGKLDGIRSETGLYRQQREQLDRAVAARISALETKFSEQLKETKLDRKAYVLDEREAALREARDIGREKRDELDLRFSTAVRVLKMEPELERQLQAAIDRYDIESKLREDALRRFVERYDGVDVVHTALLTDSAELALKLKSQVKDSTPIAATESQANADRAMELLAGMAEGRPAGFDIRPAYSTMLDALRSGKVSQEAQLAGLRAAAKQDGLPVQETLAAIVKDSARAEKVRVAATRAMVENVQLQGFRLKATDADSLKALASDKATPAKVRDELLALAGALKPSAGATGDAIRGFDPRKLPPAIPPKEKEKEKEKPKEDE